MRQLHDLQFKFMRALFYPDQRDIHENLSASGPEYGDRLDLYRSNVFGSLTDALRIAYPVVLRLVGDEFFQYAASAYIRRFPSRSGDLREFGRKFPEFLAQFQPASGLPYLPDSAHLDWACHEVFFAADPPPFPLARLKKLPRDRQEYSKFKLSPVCRLVSSAYPIHRIWEVNQVDSACSDNLSLDEGGVQLLVRRVHLAIDLAPLDRPDYEFLCLLEEGHSLRAALDFLAPNHPDFDLSSSLKRFIENSVLTDFLL